MNLRSSKNQKSSLIKVSHLFKSFGTRHILKDITFKIEQDSIVTIIGPNGAGKSTLIKILAGILTPSSGSVHKAKNLKIGYLSQKAGTNTSMPITVKRLLELSGNHNKCDIFKALDLLQIRHLYTEDFHSLSGGQVQRCLLCRCLLKNPNLLILDEPTLNLDFEGRIAFYQLLADIKKIYGCSILIVSHDLHLVMSKSDIVLCLNHHLCCQGKAESIEKHPEYKHLFPFASKDLALYTHHHNHKHPLCEGGKTDV